MSEALRYEVKHCEEEKNPLHPGNQSKRRKNANPESAGIFFSETEKTH